MLVGGLYLRSLRMAEVTRISYSDHFILGRSKSEIVSTLIDSFVFVLFSNTCTNSHDSLITFLNYHF